MSRKRISNYKIGERFQSRGRQMTEADVRMLIACAGAEHPLHTDPIFASNMDGLKGLIVQGALVLGVVDALFNETVFTGDEVVLTYGYEKIRFIRPIYINDVLRAEFELTECKKDNDYMLMTFKVSIYNQEDVVAFAAVETFYVQEIGGQKDGGTEIF